jgi:aminoglycoside 6'-N-acetyltransferase I
MTIRAIEASEDDDWLRMRVALWPDCPPEKHRQEMAEILRDTERGTVFVSVAPDGRLQGFVEASLRSDHVEGCQTRPVGYVEGWYVEPEFRHQGVGRALVAAAEDWARAKGCREMASDAEIENLASQAAHRRLGYAEVGRTVHFRKEIAK